MAPGSANPGVLNGPLEFSQPHSVFRWREAALLAQGANPERVIWVFDEDRDEGGRDVVASTTNYLDYTFTSDPTNKQSVSNRRIDAFFKSGSGYRSAWALVPVTNAKVSAEVQVKPNGPSESLSGGALSGLQLAVGSQLHGDWELDGARLGTLGNSGVQDADSSHTLWNFPSNADLSDTKNAWISLAFKSPSSNRTLQLIKPLPDLENKLGEAANIQKTH